MSLSRLRSRGPRVQGGDGEASPTAHPHRALLAAAGDGEDGEADNVQDLPTTDDVRASSIAKGKAALRADNTHSDEAESYSEDWDDSADEWIPPQHDSVRARSTTRAAHKRPRTEHSDDEDLPETGEQSSAAPKKRGMVIKKKAPVTASPARVVASPSSSTATSASRTSSTVANDSGRAASSTVLSTATSTSSQPNLGRAAGLAALAKGSGLSAKQVIDRLHQARAMADADVRRARGEDVADVVYAPLPSASRPQAEQRAQGPSKPTAQSVISSTSRREEGGSGNGRLDTVSSPSSSPALTTQASSRTPPGGPSTHPKPSAAPSMSVASWLGVAHQDSDLPWPTVTPREAIVQDRDSVFIAFVFPFPPTAPGSESSAAPTTAPIASALTRLVSTYLSHLIRTVQPNTVPLDLLPEHLRSAPPHKRGASHDMYAARTKVLKFGRDGSRGPADWAPWETADDDGERWGAQKIAKVIQEEQATDVLVFVSRWYGGTLLGPDRFAHITNVARTTLRLHMANQKVDRIRSQLVALDARASALRATLAQNQGTSTQGAAPSSYADLTEAKGQRLLLAKRKMVELLESKVAQGKGSSVPSGSSPVQ